MVCQHCQERQATTHIKRTINGKTTEMYVCSECAAKQGVGMFAGNGLDVSNLFGGLFAAPSLRESDTQECCPSCAKSFRDIVKSGIVGCPDCYIRFYDRLQPSIQRIHGKTSHVGKIAVTGSQESRLKRETARLKEELNRALAAQEYERCAQLRDQIKELEGDEHE